ncbi:MAG TPA: LuxR C-terminal-related transcriptional regulator [Burkholderiales bacterium]|nr:LuxR C-terminal-related transcriptional regulator [Burkholderiales bacterium]
MKLSSPVWDFIDEAHAAASLVALQSVAMKYVAAAGFTHCGFAVNLTRPQADNDRYRYFHNIPEPWGRYRYESVYRSKDAQRRDPLLAHLLRGQPPTAFSGNGIVTHTNREIIALSAPVLRRANDFGVRSGILVPLNTSPMAWSFMVMTSDETNDVRDMMPLLPDVHFLSHHLHCAARRILERQERLPVLSKNEIEILRWCAIGKTSWEIATILRLGESTVNLRLTRVAQKLNVRGRQAACAKALTLGLISL